MTTILVPAPPKSAFNKDRPVSDLLKGQLKHFQHIEASLPTTLQSGMTARDYATEAGAAKYIAHLTKALMKSGSVTPIRRAAKTPQKLALAASAAAPKPAKKARSRKVGKR